MKTIWDLVPAAAKAILYVVGLLISMGWIAFVSIDALTTSRVNASIDIMREIRRNDMDHLNGRFDRVLIRFDRLENQNNMIINEIRTRK